MITTVALAIAMLVSLATMVVLGGRRTALLTPLVVTLGIFVVPGPRAASLPLSAAWLLSLLVLTPRAMCQMRRFSVLRPVGAFALFLATMGLAILWSPDRLQGLRILLQGVLSLGAAVAVFVLTDSRDRDRVLASFLFVGTLAALVVIVFRFSPTLEAGFLRSPVASILIEPNLLRDVTRGYWDQGNNILDPAKSGAMFVNANVASVYLASLFAASMGPLLSQPGLWPKFLSLTLGFGVICTGSRIGLVSILSTPLVLAAITWRGSLSRRTIMVSVAVLSATGAALLMNHDLLMRFSLTALRQDQRLLLWPLAAQRVLDNPILGGGFGDWEAWLARIFGTQSLQRIFPPHNIVLHLALWGGVFLLGTFALLLYALVRQHVEALGRSPSRAPYAAAALCMIYVILLHASLDNFFLFEWHVGPMFVGLLACLALGQDPGVLPRSEPT